MRAYQRFIKKRYARRLPLALDLEGRKQRQPCDFDVKRNCYVARETHKSEPQWWIHTVSGLWMRIQKGAAFRWRGFVWHIVRVKEGRKVSLSWANRPLMTYKVTCRIAGISDFEQARLYGPASHWRLGTEFVLPDHLVAAIMLNSPYWLDWPVLKHVNTPLPSARPQRNFSHRPIFVA